MGGAEKLATGLRVYLAERDPRHHAWAKRGVEGAGLRLRILLSYWYYKDAKLDALFAKYFTEPYPEVFADSGAYSAFTQGVSIDWRDYAAWLKRWRDFITTYATLDVIGDHAATMANQRRLEDIGLAPIPAFHVGSAYGDLAKLTEEYRYIALGGLVPYMRAPKRVMPHLVKCFRLAEGRSVFHGFGVTTWRVLKALPWYSVDSSSWGSGFRFGQVPVFDDRQGRFHTLALGDPNAWAKHGALVRSLGLDPQDFADRSRYDRAKACALSALSYMQAERWLRQLHGEVHIPGDECAPTGLRAHLVDANPINLRDADAGIKLHLTDARSGRGGGGDTSRAMDVLGQHR